MQKSLSFFLVFFFFLSLSADWGEDLCEDQTCSGHGECQDDGENEWCACDEGYIADGMECILGCNGVTCSGHGVCSVVSGAEVCTCEAGFHATGLNCILNEASTVDTLAILNGTDCYNTGNCHYRLIFATGAYDFTPALSSLYDIIINVLDSENVWHNYRKTVAQCVTEGVCDNVDAQYIDFWFQHNVNGNQYVTAELLGNGDDASDDMYHDVLIDYCYGVNCGTGGSCDGTSGYPVCSCEEGYVLRGGICEEGWFEDENLAAAVVELLQYKGYEIETETDIEPEMLEDITSLPLKGKNISSLAGIGLFSSLSVLDISGNNISDLSPLAECSGLKVLNISGNPANDLNPLSNLPLFSIDISYSGVYNLNPLVSNTSLQEIVLANTIDGRHGIVRPENTNVAAWLAELDLSGCNTLSLYDMKSSRIGTIDINTGCYVHGSCVLGQCVCDEGYVLSELTNICFNPNSCEAGFHMNLSYGICVSNRIQAECDDSDPGKQFPNSYLEWKGQIYGYPSGFTNRELCLIEDPNCDAEGAQSICRWECRDGYRLSRDNSGCIPFAEREIPAGTFNRLILPNISRQDVVLEPVPGVPSFAPVFRAEIYYDYSTLSSGWHFDLPRVEFNINVGGNIVPFYSWNKEKLYVYMPWGKEEYLTTGEETYFNFENTGYIRIKYYPAPGQNLFSYIVLETTTIAAGNIKGSDIAPETDLWKITRYGEDGSVTEFERKQAKRPGSYEFMDYIPISKHITRDKKETLFEYEWRILGDWYSKINSVSIIDPLQRVIKVSADSEAYGLMGKPASGKTRLYEALLGNVTIFTGIADSEGVVEDSLKKAAKYNFSRGFSMEATVYKDENPYRKDTYSPGLPYSQDFNLNSEDASGSPSGHTVWSVSSDGYSERKIVKGTPLNPEEYIEKSVSGRVIPSYQFNDPARYSLSSSWYKTTTIYGIKKNGQTTNERIVEDYFTNWAQPAKRVTCAYNSNGNCDKSADKISEEIKYNVSGSPIYFKNADGQVTVNLYDTTSDTNAESYNLHFHADPHTYPNFDQTIPDLDLNFVRADNLRKTGSPVCSVLYSLDGHDDDINAMLLNYIIYGMNHNSDLCSNTGNSRVTNYEWTKEDWGKPYDLKTVTYPDGKTKTFTYDYDISSFFQNAPQPSLYAGYIPNGKVWGETVTGSNNQNTLQTCYAYNNDYQLVAQGIGTATNCAYKKGFVFDSDSGLLMTRDFSYNGNTETLSNDYIYDNMGRKVVERNSAGVSTVYVYDSLDRVVFTFFGCNVDSESFGTVYNPYNFDNDDSVGGNGTGVTFQTASGQFPYNGLSCEYYRKYKYDVMSNLVETDFFEYWGVNADNQVEPLSTPKKIRQFTEYDKIGRPVRSCQSDGNTQFAGRCIETEHDAFGNITKKTENGEERIITYDLRNRPLTVTVDGLQTEEYSYNDENCDTYCDKISNKYGKTLTTYKDRWGRAAKSVDPFENETVTTYESDYSDNITSQITTSSNVKTGEIVWTYDDLDRKLSETRKQFIPGSESTTNVNHVTWWEYDSIGNVVSVESSDGTKQIYSYDSLNRPVETVNYEKINSNDVETSYSENSYDANGRLSRTETTRNNQTITEDYGYDTFGRVTSVKTTDSSTQNPQTRYRVKFYNTGGQVIWEADEESDSDPRNFPDLGLWHVEIGNEKYYTYNAFGDLEKTVYVMTRNGKGLGSIDLNPWLNSGQITTNFEYDIFGRIKKRINDRSGVTEYNYYTSNTSGSHSRNKLESIQIFPAPDDGDTDYTTSQQDSRTQTYTYTYDDKGDELTVAYQEGNYLMEVDFTRDDYGRITGKTSDGSVPVTQTFTYNMRNLLETATDTVGNAAATSVTRLYDSFGNPYSETVSADNVTKTVSRRMTDAKTYQFTYPDGKTLRKTATGSDLDSIEYNNSEIASYSRANGVLTAITKGQNLIETFSYNNWNMLDNHTVSNANTNADVYDMTYGYSRGWHLIEKADGIKNTSDKYSYDSYYRLKEVKYDFANNTAARTDSFFQDGVHNIEQSTENGTTFAWGVDKLNRLREKKIGSNTEVAYEYDERNNMIEEDRSGTANDRTYIYDDLNRLIEVKDGSQNTIATYTYDAFNRRITKTVGNTTERYTYDDWDVVEISTNSNDYTNIIDSGTDRHIAIEVTANNTSTLYYFLTDERGNVTAITDESGNILERYRYRVYGDFEILDAQFAPKNCNNQTCYATNLHNFLWGGSLYEPETGLYWMRNRYYHIDMHRFINQDPIGIWGDANNLGNGFAYVAGMVIEASDPSGLQEGPSSGLTIFIYDKSYQYNIEAGKSPETADRNASFARIGASLYCSPTTNFFDAISSVYDILDLMNRSVPEEYSFVLPEENPWEEVYDNNWLLVPKRDIEGQISGFEFVYVKHKYVNTQTGEERYELEDGTILSFPKDGEPSCAGPSCGRLGYYPSTPDSTDSIQTYFANQFIKKILEMHENKNFLEIMEEEGPVVKYEDNGRKVFFFNPYYKGKDPMKEFFWGTKNADGTNGFVRNYFAPGAEYGYDSTTHEKFQQSGFPQTNVDPYSNLQQGGFIQTNVDPYWY